jgi:hypothetical protein
MKRPEGRLKKKMKLKDLQTFVTEYADLTQYILHLEHSSIHAAIMDDVGEFKSRGYNVRKSIRMALDKNRHPLQSS